MKNLVVEVTDQFGGYVRSTRDILTGYIFVNVFNGRTNEAQQLLLDPKEPEALKWLKQVYQPLHLDMLLGKGQ